MITTTRVTHATPAGFSTHVRDRDFEDVIAEQYLELQPEVILGGGARHFDAAQRKDGRDLYAQFAAQGYAIIRQSEELEGSGGSKLLGTFTNSHLPFEIDRARQGVPAPSLAEMTRKGLELLSASSQGFVVQVEAGRIDHANHNNDPSAMVWDVLAADEALEVILDFADRTPETLVILASDHGTGGGAVYGVGNAYLKASEAFDRIAARKASFDFVLEKLGASPTRAEAIDAVGEFLSLTISPEQAELLVDAIQGKPSMPRLGAFHEQPVNSLGWVAAAGENFSEPEHLNIHYSAGQHTAGPVPIALYGTGTAEARLGLVDITDVFGWMTQAMRVEWENPVMNEAEALSILRGMSKAGA